MASRFDEIIDFRNTDSIKWDMAGDAIPLWVADMDFRSPQAITDAVVEAAHRGIFGYSAPGVEYFEAISSWMQRRYGWEVKPEWIVRTHGVVVAFSMAIRACTKPGDAVLLQPPVYHPMHAAILDNDRRLVYNELQLINGKFVIDFEDFERKIVDEHVTMFLMCSPSNPAGRAWTLDELTRMGDICLRHGVLVVSDEIHQDLVLPGHQHHVFANIKPEFAPITITCTAPSKTFSVAGFFTSNTFIANPELRKAFTQEQHLAGMHGGGNRLGYVACRAGYEQGEAWLEECVQYIADNAAFMRDFLAAHIPQIRMVELEATYLAFLDCRDLGMDDEALDAFFTDKAKLRVNAGKMFGPGGSGFVRVNIACPRSTLEQALEQLRAALAE
jgi:cystathionine beta-lyase